MKTLQKLQLTGMLLIFCGVVTSCAKEKYVAKPLDAQKVSAVIFSKDFSNPQFRDYLVKQGYAQNNLPVLAWDLNALTYTALYFNPKLDIAKAQLALADVSVKTANQQPNPSLNASIARSNQANGDIRPWSYGLNVEIPLETNNKRQIRVEEASYLRNAAETTVAEIAWQLRSQIAKDLLAYHENIALQQAISRELNIHGNIISMLEKRLQLGLIDNTTLSDAKLLQQKTQLSANALPTRLIEIKAALAADIGLSADKLNGITIKPMLIDEALKQQSGQLKMPQQFAVLQQNALLNRLDIRHSLAKYGAAEAKIKLEIAKQTPDIVLTPGFIFDFGDKIWSLGLTSLLNVLNKNQTLIAEATQLREIEGAQFEALQTSIIGDLSLAYARYQSALQQINAIQSQLNLQSKQQQNLQKQLDAGLVDRLIVTQYSLHNLLADQELLRLKFDCLKMAIAIEDLMQKPLFNDDSLSKIAPDQSNKQTL